MSNAFIDLYGLNVYQESVILYNNTGHGMCRALFFVIVGEHLKPFWSNQPHFTTVFKHDVRKGLAEMQSDWNEKDASM